MGDILCITRKKTTEDTDTLPTVAVLKVNRDGKLNSMKQKQNLYSTSDGESKYLNNSKKEKSRKKDKNIGPRSQEKWIKNRDGQKNFTDKTTNPTSSNTSASNETKKQLAGENKSNKKLSRNRDNKANNETSTQSSSTVRSLSRSSDDIREAKSGEDKETNGTVVKVVRDSNVDSYDEDNDDANGEEHGTDEENTDEEDTDEDGTDEDDTDEFEDEENDTNESSSDRDIQDSDTAADIRIKQFKGILNEKLNLANHMSRNKFSKRSPLLSDLSQMADYRQEDIVKPGLLYNVETGMTVQSVKEILQNHNKNLSDATKKQAEPIDSTKKQADPIDLTKKQTDPIDSTKKQADPIDSTKKQTDPIDSTKKQTDLNESNNLPATLEKNGEIPSTNSPKNETLFNKKYSSV